MTKLIIRRQQGKARYYTEDLGGGVGLDMILIPSGSFLMGTEDREIDRLCETYSSEHFRTEGPQHRVTLPTFFFIGRYPITQAQWRAVASLPLINRKLEPDPSIFEGDNRPVENVSWYEAVEFCDRLSRHTGREYRLPTEAEWEYVCRAGTTTPYYFGDTITSELANYERNREETSPVEEYPANAFGISDMHGNVWEWCLDHWHDSYKDTLEELKQNGNKRLTGKKSANRTLRGGSWSYTPEACRSAFRNYDYPDLRNDIIGFRVVCSGARTL
ncbi:MAG: formylglycine-generating enzyme family protein [Cyanophyceae cyanobacterium]